MPAEDRPPKATGRPLRFLVLGGNGFLGLEFVEAAVARLGDAVRLTVLHRGNAYWGSDTVLRSLSQVSEVICGRADIARCTQLACMAHDWAVDFSAQAGVDVAAALAALNVKGYLHISSEAVYGPVLAFRKAPLEESAYVPPHEMSFVHRAIMHADPYLVAKIEQEVALFAHADVVCTCALRLPFVIGRRDSTHRLALLLLLLEAGEVSISAAGRVPISFVDGRTVASAALHLLTRERSTVCGKAFNVAQPPLSLEQLLQAAAPPASAPPHTALLPWTAAQAVYDAVVFAQALPFTLNVSRLHATGWQPPLGLHRAIAEAANFTRASLLHSPDRYASERRQLARKANALLARHGNGRLGGLHGVLHRFGLQATTPAEPTIGTGFAMAMRWALACGCVLAMLAFVWRRRRASQPRPASQLRRKRN